MLLFSDDERLLEKLSQRKKVAPYDYLTMFKILLLACLYNLWDEAIEYELLDSLSCRCFVGCDDQRVPDAKTIWLYRARLIKEGKQPENWNSAKRSQKIKKSQG